MAQHDRPGARVVPTPGPGDRAMSDAAARKKRKVIVSEAASQTDDT
jgi:hypothetical protein